MDALMVGVLVLGEGNSRRHDTTLSPSIKYLLHVDIRADFHKAFKRGSDMGETKLC